MSATDKSPSRKLGRRFSWSEQLEVEMIGNMAEIAEAIALDWWFGPHREFAVDLCSLVREACTLVTRGSVDLARAERALARAGWALTEGEPEWQPPPGPSAKPVIDAIDDASAALDTLGTAIQLLADRASGRPTAAGPPPIAFAVGDEDHRPPAPLDVRDLLQRVRALPRLTASLRDEIDAVLARAAA